MPRKLSETADATLLEIGDALHAAQENNSRWRVLKLNGAKMYYSEFVHKHFQVGISSRVARFLQSDANYVHERLFARLGQEGRCDLLILSKKEMWEKYCLDTRQWRVLKAFMAMPVSTQWSHQYVCDLEITGDFEEFERWLMLYRMGMTEMTFANPPRKKQPTN